MGKETDRWPFVEAKWYGRVNADVKRTVRWIVIHDMEYDETLHAAEDIAQYFATMPDGRKASAHVCVDADSIIQCVPDSQIAYGAPGANAAGIQIELAGYQRQTREQWLDDYGVKLLANGANVVAQYCAKYAITPIHLTDAQLASGVSGLVGHDQVSRVFKQSDHTDPGPNFPWDWFIAHVGPLYVARLNANTGSTNV